MSIFQGVSLSAIRYLKVRGTLQSRKDLPYYAADT